LLDSLSRNPRNEAARETGCGGDYHLFFDLFFSLAAEFVHFPAEPVMLE
jgi:hypothetical protein